MLTMTLDELTEKMKKEDEWRKKNWFLAFFIDAYEFFWYIVPRVLKDCRYEIKWAWQRVFRGYDDRALWGLDSYLTDIIIPVLIYLRQNKHGVPSAAMEGDEPFSKSIERWEGIMDKMILAFSAIKDNQMCLNNPEQAKALESVIDEGLGLFGKYFQALWD